MVDDFFGLAKDPVQQSKQINWKQKLSNSEADAIAILIHSASQKKPTITVDKYNEISVNTKDEAQSKVLNNAVNVVDKLDSDCFAAVCQLLNKAISKSGLLWPSISNR